jgi:hypothetical protein
MRKHDEVVGTVYFKKKIVEQQTQYGYFGKLQVYFGKLQVHCDCGQQLRITGSGLLPCDIRCAYVQNPKSQRCNVYGPNCETPSRTEGAKFYPVPVLLIFSNQ